MPRPGVEIDEAAFLAAERLPTPRRPGHDAPVPKVIELAHGGETFFDPAASYGAKLPMHRRPTETEGAGGGTGMAEHVVGPVAEFPPGTHRVVRLGRAEVGVFNVGGRFYALPNVCPHQYGPLCAGAVGGTTACSAETGWRFAWVREGEVVACPWHGLEFDITTGRCLASPRLRVRRYPVRVDDGQVIVTL